MRAFYDQGITAYHGRHDREEGLRLFSELEAISLRNVDPMVVGVWAVSMQSNALTPMRCDAAAREQRAQKPHNRPD